MRQRAVETRFESLEGDCLLGAAVMIYLAQFTHKVREKYLRKWRDQLAALEGEEGKLFFRRKFKKMLHKAAMCITHDEVANEML